MEIIRKIIPCKFKVNGYECNAVIEKLPNCEECDLYEPKISIPRISIMLTPFDYVMLAPKTSKIK